ncbi:hypothetical protein BpHYR1_047951 [Brachionus plicatilis]|uniref:Uncharacterized protein n=1 Tax=Brachionus plicatilis TaxID=10195 RepID=A0A3M7S167_BRAPC|nr:hypothetical protein BpHYR1_047951 [Brachionus plicatilis]
MSAEAKIKFLHKKFLLLKTYHFLSQDLVGMNSKIDMIPVNSLGQLLTHLISRLYTYLPQMDQSYCQYHYHNLIDYTLAKFLLNWPNLDRYCIQN